VREGVSGRMKDEGGRMKEKQIVFTSSFILPTSSLNLRPPSRSGYCLKTRSLPLAVLYSRGFMRA
jgi:hypothetical protein